MAAATISITLRTGEKKEFSSAVGDEVNSCKLLNLQTALSKLQKQTNDALTEMVNQEKAGQSGVNGKDTSKTTGMFMSTYQACPRSKHGFI